MVDNGENILVEFDYDNVSLIDPNKVIDNDGKVKDRLVKQENLVMYANLECSVVPRTKLAIGAALNDNVRTISVGKINFLNPGFKTFLDNNWSDEITGKGTIKGVGVNQPKLNAVKNPQKSDDYYITQSTYSNGTPGAVDNGLLGIKTIDMSIDSSFYPQVTITLEDVKGRALFEGGNSSPYAAFYQLPYPIFYLTLKGYYGKAVRMPLMLQTFNSVFDGTTGNFKVTLKLFGYKYGIMSYVNWGHMLAVPHMYNSFVSTNQVSQGNQQTGGENVKPIVIAATVKASVPQPTASVGASSINTGNTQNPVEETATYAEINEPKVEQKDTTEQIKAMIQRFMREGYRNPALNTTPTYVRNGVELQDIKKLKQNGRVLEYELDQLLAMMETVR